MHHRPLLKARSGVIGGDDEFLEFILGCWFLHCKENCSFVLLSLAFRGFTATYDLVFCSCDLRHS